MSIDKKENSVSVIELSSYVKPVVTEYINKEFVTWGNNNSYFDYLINSYNESPTNASIIDGISNLIYGKGLSALDSSKKTEQYAQMISLFKEEDIENITKDYKKLGKYALQCIYNGKHDKIVEVAHIPVNYLAPEKANEDGEIEAYYHSVDFSNERIIPKRISAFGTSKDAIEILYVQPYAAGSFYFSPTDYQSGVVYAEMEDEMSSFHINNLQNGLTASTFLNFNNGVPDKKTQQDIEKDIIKKWGGAKSRSKIIVAFNKNKDSAATVDNLQLNDASQQYQFLSDEATDKLLRAHKVTSPVLIGIKDNSGLGNNAEELQTAFALFYNQIIKPFQSQIIRGLDKVLAFNNVSLKLYFKTLKPLEFQDVDGVVDKEVKEEETGVEASTNMSEEMDLEKYTSETPEGYSLHCVEYDITEPSKYELELASTSNSEQDTKLWKIRYAYNVGTSKTPEGKSRTFCNRMMSLSKSGKVFRKEDIEKMSADGVNGKFAHTGGKYDIFLYGGGVNCYHRWERRIFKKRRGDDGKPLGGNATQNTFPVNVNEAKRQGAKIPTNNKDVAIAEIDKPNKGSLKN